ncbi:hypothetical protein RJ640_021600 [Escallonia rubra]|uniref:Uncharacterized protein n=1 Tax=Escallonia rubra TaxID=112253 RepID=A0AA88RR44_9ASTE|nr:hypothetical protein RJ640_021600 [Escallonia rubra]
MANPLGDVVGARWWSSQESSVGGGLVHSGGFTCHCFYNGGSGGPLTAAAKQLEQGPRVVEVASFCGGYGDLSLTEGWDLGVVDEGVFLGLRGNSVADSAVRHRLQPQPRRLHPLRQLLPARLLRRPRRLHLHFAVKQCQYKVLGLGGDCTADEICSAYRRLAL